MPLYRKALAPKIISATHDISVTGTQAITGVGFKPSAIIAFAAVNNSSAVSWGMADASTQGTAPGSIYQDTAGRVATLGKLIPYLETAASNYASAVLTSMDTDGFTITWAKANTPTGTADLTFHCFPPAS